MSTPLPSFVQLMASLGLEQKTSPPTEEQSLSPPSSPRSEEDRTTASPVRAKSNPSLHETAARQRNTRYSPYSPLASKRRGSVSSASSSSSGDASPIQETFAGRLTSRSRRTRNPLCLNIYGSSSDLPANMPISTYVRRKTPGTTPTSPTFPQDTGSDPASSIPMLTIPVLPSLLPNSASSESFPLTPDDSEISFSERVSPPRDVKPYPDFHENGYSHYLQHFTGVRISTASRVSLHDQYLRRSALVDVA